MARETRFRNVRQEKVVNSTSSTGAKHTNKLITYKQGSDPSGKLGVLPSSWILRSVHASDLNWLSYTLTGERVSTKNGKRSVLPPDPGIFSVGSGGGKTSSDSRTYPKPAVGVKVPRRSLGRHDSFVDTEQFQTRKTGEGNGKRDGMLGKQQEEVPFPGGNRESRLGRREEDQEN